MIKKENEDKVALLMKDAGRREDYFKMLDEIKEKRKREKSQDGNKYIQKN